MECKKCGATIPEEGIFCVSCGARADGKKECPSCKKLIDDGVTYCTYCGARTDGKKVCNNCGEIIQGSFCPKCGNRVIENNKKCEASSEIASTSATGVLCAIERIANPIIYLCILSILFICSFFIGTISTAVSSTDSVVTTSTDVFYYFGKSFESTKQYITEILNISVTSKNYIYCNALLNVKNIISLIVIIVNFIIQAIAITFGIIESVKALIKKQSSKSYKYATLSFASFIFTAVVLFLNAYADVKYYNSSNTTSIINYEYTVSMSSASIVGIVLGIILIFLAVIIAQLKKGKLALSATNLKRVIPAIIGGVITFVAILVSSQQFAFSSYDGKEVMLGSSNYLLNNITVHMFYTYTDKEQFEIYQIIVTLLLISSIVSVVIAGALSFAIKFFFDGAINENSKGVGSLCTVIISIILSIVNIILLSIAKANYIKFYEGSTYASTYAIGAGVIVVLILSALALICIITYLILNNKKASSYEYAV